MGYGGGKLALLLEFKMKIFKEKRYHLFQWYLKIPNNKDLVQFITEWALLVETSFPQHTGNHLDYNGNRFILCESICEECDWKKLYNILLSKYKKYQVS